jgi:hypothetical protein
VVTVPSQIGADKAGLPRRLDLQGPVHLRTDPEQPENDGLAAAPGGNDHRLLDDR